jgi:hypothetical protein
LAVIAKLPKLPQLLERKIYKTGQTRGADDDVIYQNRVSRTSTVLVPYPVFVLAAAPPPGEKAFENGSIVLVPATYYFGTPKIEAELAARGLKLGQNALVFYETRERWVANHPDKLKWKVAQNRRPPLGGQFVARISANTGLDGERISHGFTTTANKGAGIRSYEYASTATINACRLQLEALFWLCHDAEAVATANGMPPANIIVRKKANLVSCKEAGLLDIDRLTKARMLSPNGHTICPLCLEEFSSEGFFNRLKQAEGREVLALTVTQLNLFHIEELRYGVYNHRPYNVGWGHHHCNVVAKDSGIADTLEWMNDVVERNIALGLFDPDQNGN